MRKDLKETLQYSARLCRQRYFVYKSAVAEAKVTSDGPSLSAFFRNMALIDFSLSLSFCLFLYVVFFGDGRYLCVCTGQTIIYAFEGNIRQTCMSWQKSIVWENTALYLSRCISYSKTVCCNRCFWLSYLCSAVCISPRMANAYDENVCAVPSCGS